MNAKQAKYPQLRFKGFTDPWEQRKLGQIAEIVGGGTPSTSKPEYWDGNIDWYAPAEIGTQRYVQSSQRKITDAGLKSSSARMLPAGTVLFTSRAGIGKTAILEKEASTNQGFQSIVPVKNELDSYFIFSRTEELKRYGEVNGAGSTFVEVSGKTMAKMPINIPSMEEQREVGQFFQRLDDTIALHQRKLAKLKELKQGYLQKLFPKNGSKLPQLRFAGFADAWEQRKLSDLAERVTRKNKNNESNRPLTISAQDGLVDQNDFFDKQIASRDVSGYFLVNNGEFAYNKSYSNGYPWGAIKRLDKYDMGVLSTLYIIFRPTNVSSQFLVAYYDTTRWYKEVSKNAAEGARNHGLLNIAPTDFFSTALVIPNSIEEQQKIGSFFKQLDDTITLHQRKLEKLQELKKGYLQKMFC
ncbi:restriction endonuclease subunit S [Lacticaseibacillus paracasei]|uniref:restriction endonuclease subunit S n=1 Tax=Lacticaseibacillus paracasei TaxID=1597 RepID=UPI0021A7E8E9|nr:restriction endonuclease subunit S [Lacticaseibacillus paracasei]MCT3379513.1 restriction endonuclease subunit S [Lacticaseibacillus paracasei]